MEHKFKTAYRNILIPCIVDHENNKILMSTILGKYDWVGIIKVEEYSERNPKSMPELPVFQYIGKKDIHGEEIYLGHLVKKIKSHIIYKVVFHETDFSFCLQWEERIFSIYKEMEIEIVGHSSIPS